MEIGLIGLGKMGGNMRERLRRAGHTVVGYDRNPDLADADSLEAMVEALPSPKVVWVMVPSGDPTRATVSALKDLLGEGVPEGSGLVPRGQDLEPVLAGVAGAADPHGPPVPVGVDERHVVELGGQPERVQHLAGEVDPPLARAIRWPINVRRA